MNAMISQTTASAQCCAHQLASAGRPARASQAISSSAGVPSTSVRGGRATFAPKRAKSLRAHDGRINHAAVTVEAQNTIAPKDLRVEDIKCMDIKDITAPVKSDMDVMNQNLLNIVGERHPMLMAAAEQIFGAGGKKLRPMLIFLVSHGTAQLGGLTELTPQHRSLAEITEMIHTASLVHDDVLDECDTRRGSVTVHSKFGTRLAVLAGDYLFAQSSWFLANLDNLEVIKLISKVIADFANGEIAQASSLFDCDVTLETYMDKSFYKTASLIAASCRSAAVFSGMEEEVKQDMFNYGKHLGLAFQVVDDILDFTQTEEQLGKPQGQDMASGNLTCPIIFAMQKNPALRELIESEFQEEGSLEEALQMVYEAGGIESAMALAREEGQKALDSLHRLPEGKYKDSLVSMVGYVLQRIY
mmetsp:Transcript_16753/g.28275  ORF Transcript_16753/g.28275 Transcript_16753/m.28275 type:complete len:416 (+) Transcript_16753:139-1386(+)